MASKINTAWKTLFEQLDIKNQIMAQGFYYISAREIKRRTGEEARLMSKFDYRESRPGILKNNNYTIISVKNGHYAIVDADGYMDIESSTALIPYYSERLEQLETLPNDFRSESQVIDAVFASGIFEDFTGENDLFLTIRGRLRSKPFDFFMNTPKGDIQFNIDGVQVEVDAGYEAQRVYLIEAKMGEVDNFHLRQLYYPYRMWQLEGISKEIVPIFLSYYEGIISLTQYKFTDETLYNSSEVVKSKHYTFEHEPIVNTLEAIFESIDPSTLTESDGSLYPQANDVRKVRDVIEQVNAGIDTKATIAEYWNVDDRQGDYYANAATYLGYLEKQSTHWKLTEKGYHYLSLPTSHRQRDFIKSILSKTVFYELTQKMLDSQSLPSKETIVGIMSDNLNKLNDTTIRRRASTVKKWLMFIHDYFS